MRVAGKVWGKTQEVERNTVLEIHAIDVIAGHKCSKHRHQTKYNGFYVTDGCLLIRVWKPDSGTVDEHRLTDGEWLVVSPGQFHQFEAIDDTQAVEVYWTELRHDDIERETYGE